MGLLSVVKFLIETKHININSQESGYNKTAFFCACEKGKLDVVKYLYNAGADISLSGRFAQNCLIVACQERQFETLKFLIEIGALDDKRFDSTTRRTLIFLSAEVGTLESLKYLIEVGQCDFNIRDWKGRTPLELACGAGKLESVKYLISLGAIWNEEKNSNVMTPLRNAVFYGRLEVVKFLVSIGGRGIDKIDWKTISPIVSDLNKERLLKYLISIGIRKLN